MKRRILGVWKENEGGWRPTASIIDDNVQDDLKSSPSHMAEDDKVIPPLKKKMCSQSQRREFLPGHLDRLHLESDIQRIKEMKLCEAVGVSINGRQPSPTAVSAAEISSTSSASLSSSMASTSAPSASASLRIRKKYFDSYNFPHCDDVKKYEKMAKIGQGSFGEVFKARDRMNNKKVALKKILMDNEQQGFPVTALREIRILHLLKHENVVNLIEMCRERGAAGKKHRTTFYLVFDFCEHDLAGLLCNAKVTFNLGEIKKVMQQLLNALHYIHCYGILHRDLKAANVLITKNGVLKLADFGLARAYSASAAGLPNRYTNKVVTLWYRSPELLLGDRDYGPPVDLWSAGCIMAEMWTRSPITQGSTEADQIVKISKLCGSFTPDVWPDVENLPLYSKMVLPSGDKRRVRELLKPYVQNSNACDLIDKLLVLDPNARIDADSALNHDFFWTDPMPADLGKMLSHHLQSMFKFLAPSRQRPTQMMRNYKQFNANSQDNGYQDRIY